ncbi:class I SAM-dependent methyltransferase [Candidatus Pelagibacter sp. HIMB1517]|uniref:class I SAM-dependent methyltransferase n=1 Tax=Candidatus Pelagibacter sp. HIMB1517 TaxID=3413341 RepID=UPI003F8576BC
MVKKIKNCRSCQSKKLINLFNLGNFNLLGSFYKKNFSNPTRKKFSLKLILCKNCSLVQLDETVSKKILYKDYWYLSGVNLTMRNHLNSIVNTNLKILRSKKKQEVNVLDIGCNDCTLLNFYPKKINKFGIDPSNVKSKKKNKIKIIKDFFPSKKIKKLGIKFKVITSIAMFYDVDSPVNFAKNIKAILDKEGFWVIELSYLLDMLNLNSFDTICHEHLEYYSLTSLNFIMKKSDLKIFKIEFNDINGGSIRCYITHKSNKSYDIEKNLSKIKKQMNLEKNKRIFSKKLYLNFYKNIQLIKIQIKNKLNMLIKNKKTIHGYGASTKGNTILQWIKLNSSYLKCIADRNPLKWGAVTLGSNIDIVSESFSKKNKPDFYFVLPWHFRKEIVKREKTFIKKGGKLIFPLPSFKIISK